jgi:predicted porin
MEILMKQLKTIAISLLAIGAQQAAAQQAGLKVGGVDIYGRLNVGVERISATGATTPSQNANSRIRVTDSYSYLGFKGSRDFGDDLSAFFQVESLVRLDNVGSSNNNTSATTSANQFSTRNSGVGLRSKAFGELLLGRWVVYYTNHQPVDMTFTKAGMNTSALAILGASGSGWGGNEGTGTVANGTRENNVIRYVSPRIAGFGAKLAYVAPEAPNNAGANATTARDTGVEISLNYASQQGYFDLSRYTRDDVGNVLGNDSKATKATGGIKLYGVKLGAVLEHLEHKNAGAGVHRERDATILFAAYEIGPWEVGTTLGKAAKVKNKAAGGDVADSGAKYLQATVTYALDKQTNLYGTFAKVTNEAQARYDFFNQGAVGDTNSVAANAIGRGSDPKSIMVGMAYFF